MVLWYLVVPLQDLVCVVLDAVTSKAMKLSRDIHDILEVHRQVCQDHSQLRHQYSEPISDSDTNMPLDTVHTV